MATIVGGGLLVALAILGVLASTRRGDRYYLVLAALGAVGAAITVVRSMEGGVAFIGLFDLPAALVVFVVAAEALGLPAPVAKRLGVGFRSRAWEYDRALARVVSPLYEPLFGESPPDPGRDAAAPVRERRVRDGRRQVARLRALRAPDEDWRSLTNRYADAYEAVLEAVASASASSDRAELERRILLLHRERDRLRAKYRAEAAQLLAGSRAARLLRQSPRD